MQATLVFPLEQALVEPEVIIFNVKPRQALWIALALNYNKGVDFPAVLPTSAVPVAVLL